MTAIANHPHRVSGAVAEARASIGSVADVALWSMDPTETAAIIDEISRTEAQLAELEGPAPGPRRPQRGRQPGRGVLDRELARVATRTTRPAAHRVMRTAHGLDEHGPTRVALAHGALNLDQAEAILRALAELPDDLDPSIVTQAEARLLDLAGDHDAKALRVLGRRLLEVVSPEAADAHEARLLERQERAAAAATRLTLWDDGHGRVHGRFTLDTLTGAAFKRALWAIAAPRHQAAQGPLGPVGERRPTPGRLGQAFVEYVQRYPANRLPKAGGLNATVVVTMTLETLLGGLKAAQLDTGETIGPGAARRLACEAGIIPAVLGGKSQVLDLGRKTRFHTEAQRIAKTIEAGGCQIQGCDEPPGCTHLHHPVRWVDGGCTDRDGIMICPWHHTRAHDTRYQMTRLPTGKYTFNRRN